MNKKQLQVKQLEIRAKLGTLAEGDWTDDAKAGSSHAPRRACNG